MTEKYYIYSLEKDGIAFYVGVTTDVKRRLIEHKQIIGSDIEIMILEEYVGSFKAASALEQFWIKKYADNGVILKNTNIDVSSKIDSKCLKCQKPIFQSSGKRKKKFCSTSCRVMYHRKKVEGGAKEKAVHNLIMENLSEMKQLISQIPFAKATPASFDGSKSKISHNEPLNFSAPQKVLKSFEYYRAAKKELETEEQWQEMKAEILAADHLSSRQKNLLTTTNI